MSLLFVIYDAVASAILDFDPVLDFLRMSERIEQKLMKILLNIIRPKSYSAQTSSSELKTTYRS